MKMYQLVAPTSMGVRITPTVRQPVHVSDTFFMQATSADSNALPIPAALGLKTKVLTTFVKDSPIAKFIQGDLRRRGIDYEGAEVPQGGPGATATSSTLPIAALACAARAWPTTARAKSAAR